MLLTDVFLPDLILDDLRADNKEEVFEEMIDHFCGIMSFDKREDILAAIRERESKMSTGVQKGIAIPHGKSSAVEKVFGVIGVSKKGIDYDSLDGGPVYIVLMILAPPVEAERHLHLLQRMAGLLRSPDFFKDIRSAPGTKEIFDILRKYEYSSEAGDE